MDITRNGITAGRKLNYALRVDGNMVGRISVRKQRDPMVGGPHSYHTVFHAKRSAYDTGHCLATQAEAEAWLIAFAQEIR